MKKILYIVSTLRRTGPINQLSYIIKYLNKKKFDPIVLTLSSELKEDSMKSYFTDVLKVRVETLGLSRIQGLFFAKSHIKTFIKENNIDIVHSQGIRADGLVSSIDVPKVATLRNYPYYDYTMAYGNFKGYLLAKYHLHNLKMIDAPRVVSKSISNMLKEKNHYNIDFVRNGTDTQRFENLDKEKLREKFEIKANTKVYVSVGRLSLRKDPITIIKAFKKANIEDSLLLFLGGGELEKECLKEIGSQKNINLVGKINNVHEYLGVCDYFISTSLAEGLPNTVLESMACGLPCILSNIPPHAEIREINEDSSLLFETKDISVLAKLIEDVTKKDYETMSKASKSIINNHLSAEIMSKNYQKIYEKLGNENEPY